MAAVEESLVNPQTGVMARALRPTDLAHEHGLSAQAIRNYEDAGILPPADRTATGYRRYSPTHVQALRTFLALRPGFGHQRSAAIMRAAHHRDDATLFRLIDQTHAELLHERNTLDEVAAALTSLTNEPTRERSHQAESPGAQPHRAQPLRANVRSAELRGAKSPSAQPPSAQLSAELRSAKSPSVQSPGAQFNAELRSAESPGTKSLRTKSSSAESPTTAPTIGALAHQLHLHPATLRKWEQEGILHPIRDRSTGYRVYPPETVRAAHMTSQLRRGGYPLPRIKLFLDQLHAAGDTDALHNVLLEWRDRITQRSRTMLTAAHELDRYLDAAAL